ncbi:hypothetical protein Tco_1284455 [Tanacetum coccineum]
MGDGGDAGDGAMIAFWISISTRLEISCCDGIDDDDDYEVIIVEGVLRGTLGGIGELGLLGGGGTVTLSS